MLKDLYEFKEDLGKRGIFFCLSGPISQNLVAEIGTTLEQHMTMGEAGKPTVLRVFSTVVENAQNIMRYSDEREEDLSLGIIAVGYENNHYFVLCGNMVENNKIGKLRENLTKLQNMEKDELKKYYRKKRRKGPPPGKQRADSDSLTWQKRPANPLSSILRRSTKNFLFFL